MLYLMHLSRRKFGAAALGALAPAGDSRPRLLALIVAEQFRPDYLVRWKSHFVTGGFRKLMGEGAFFPDCRHLASTFGSAALATLSTGCYPAAHGIVADHWYDPAGRKRVRAGPDLLQATTLAGEISRAGGAVYGIATTPAYARLLAGPAARQIFASGPDPLLAAHPGSLPWLAGFQRANDPEQARDANWLAINAPAGAPPLRVLRYDAAQPEEFAALYAASPFGQAAQFALLRELLDQETSGGGTTLDCIALVVESTALLGYETGADSPLMQQLVLHLDRQIETTLDHLDKSRGPGTYTLLFAGAHGAAAVSPKQNAIPGEKLARHVDAALGGDAVERYVYPFLYLRAGPRTREGRLAAARAALKFPGVAGYYTADGECSHTGEWRWRFENSFHAGRTGDVMLLYAPDAMEQYGPPRGVAYGSFYNYDAQTPLIFYGPQFQARIVERTVEAVDAVPTVAAAMGLPLPSSSTGRVLTDAFLQPRATRKSRQ